MIKAIYFDCFGLFYPDPINTLLAESSIPKHLSESVEKLDDKASSGDITLEQFISQASSILKWNHNQTKEHFLVGKKRNENLIMLVQMLRQDYRVGLLSNIGKDMMDGFFTANQLSNMFDIAILSADIRLAKPDSKIYKLACERMGTSPSETLLIDDTPEYIDGAKDTGMGTILYTSVASLKNELELYNIHLT